jgi:ubiquinone/menaquinone biosynthesis C-methylase UbiE
MSETYTHGHHDSVLRSHRWRTVENSVAYAIPVLVPGARVLDVGCGPGTITADIAERVAPGEVVAVDLSEAVLAEAAELARSRRVDNVRVEQQDVYRLPYDDGVFDVVHAHQTLQHLRDPVGALREMRRVCRPGGAVAARDGDYAGFTWYPELPELADWMALYQRCARANGGEPDAGRRLAAWARAAGYSVVTPGASVWCYATDDDRAFWGGMWEARIQQSEISAQARREGFATEDDLRRIADGWRRWTDDPDGWFAVLHGEILCRA